MIDLNRVGDTTDHGGEVVTASETIRCGGRRVARKGDQVSCPRHPDVKPNVIMEGDGKITDHGIAVAPLPPSHVRLPSHFKPVVIEALMTRI